MGNHKVISMQSEDWYTLLVDSPHVQFFSSRNWSASLLGPLSEWPLELRLYTLQAFADLRPVCLYFGPSRVAVYNEPFILLAGKTHPQLMGSTFAEIYPEIVEHINPLFTLGEQTRKASPVVNLSMVVERNGFSEEAIFDGSFVPLFGSDGGVSGFYNSVQEVTRQKVLERRRTVCDDIATATNRFTSTTIYSHIAECLKASKLDILCACIYRVCIEADDLNHTLELMEIFGFPELKGFPPKIFRSFDTRGFSPLLCAAQRDVVTEPMQESVINLDWSTAGGEPPQHLTAIPLQSGGRLYGFMVVGNNPHRPLGELHGDFMVDLQRICTSAIVATISMEEAHDRSRRLQDKLEERERQIRYIAQHSNVGIMQFSLEGSLVWANEHYHNFISRIDSGSPRDTFFDEHTILQDDRVVAKNAWQQVQVQEQNVENLELRLSKAFQTPTGTEMPTTVILSASLYRSDDSVTSVMACMTDVSRLKWAESYQAQIAHDAREAKRVQIAFTDALSHEVRNPLSAILQLADSIANPGIVAPLSLQGYEARLQENKDAAKTILDCVQHQKRILDDVLTLSKLDFTSFTLKPTVTDPAKIAKEAVDMLFSEASANAVELKVTPSLSSDQSLSGSIICDPLRISQVLINLLSNAIKFTKNEDIRRIDVSYGLSKTDPSEKSSPDMKWATQQQPIQSISELGDGEPLYLTFTVMDTGLGMTQDELTRIFNRFEQATPKTSIKYGGSGLGLYISHSLVRRHGGQIGVASIPGKGTTFAFHVQVLEAGNVLEQSNLSQTNGEQLKSFASLSESLTSTTLEDRGTDAADANIIPQQSKSNSGHHLLLVEDNLINQKLLSKQLSKAGCTVTAANHGLEALDVLRSSALWSDNNGRGLQIDAILMDWEMPVMDGLACTLEIRNLEMQGKLARRSEIIAITANVRAEQIEKAAKAGIDTVVSKPFKVSELLRAIELRLHGQDQS